MFIDELSFQKNSLILDFGCGDGTVSNFLFQTSSPSHLYAVDISESMLDIAKQKFGENEKMTFLQLDDFVDQINVQFNYCTSFSVFHWIEEKKSILERIFHSLEHGGYCFFLYCPDYNPPSRIMPCREYVTNNSPTFQKALENYQGVTYYCPTDDEMKDLLEETGFEVETIQMVECSITFNTVDEFKKWVRSWAKFVDFIEINSGKELADLYLEDFIQRYIEFHPLQSNGNLEYIEYLTKLIAKKF